MELEGPEDARIMKPNHKAVKEVDGKETLPISDEQLADQDFQKDQVNKDLKKRVNDGDDRGLRKI
ncbi:hypothetical protein RhiirA1_460848 [Rhizophagus irregularis]|uniref:Uncharacterized protein n=1 Tax=Rhizophagus irregularis TaxID=588596 RepID=A0A2N0RQL0_9GLOM|nr:hypothetical protein RhiirA1_460848 [Rhizophagus irregularis]